MNILELAGFYSNYGSNFIPTLENLDKKLNALGHHTFYIFSNRNLSKKFYEWEIPFAERHNTKLMNFRSYSFVRQAVSFIKQNQIDIVHAHFCPSIFLSMIKRRCKGVLFLEHIHSCPYNNKKTFKAFLKRARNFYFLDRTIPKICISNSMMPMVKYSFPKQNVISCINAIDFSRLKKSSRNNSDGFNVLLFGYNYYVKGVDVAIKAVLNAKKVIKDIHLDIVMGNNLLKNKERIIKEFGEIPDCVSVLEPTHDIVSLYNGHKIFLNASRSEGGSYAILEAYYCGSLCVVSDVPATKESNLPGVIYFKSENDDDLTQALLSAYSIKDNYNNDVDYVAENFSVENWSKNIIKIMRLNEKTEER